MNIYLVQFSEYNWLVIAKDLEEAKHTFKKNQYPNIDINESEISITPIKTVNNVATLNITYSPVNIKINKTPAWCIEDTF